MGEQIQAAFLPVTGGLFIQAKNVPPGSYIWFRMECAGTSWSSNFENIDSAGIVCLLTKMVSNEIKKNKAMFRKEEKLLQVPGTQGQSTSLKKTGMTNFVIPAIYSWQSGDPDLAVFCGILDP